MLSKETVFTPGAFIDDHGHLHGARVVTEEPVFDMDGHFVRNNKLPVPMAEVYDEYGHVRGYVSVPLEPRVSPKPVEKPDIAAILSSLKL